MEPCLDGPDADCPATRPAGPYTTAVEVPAGGLEPSCGIAAGSRLELLGDAVRPRRLDCDTPSSCSGP